MPTNLKYTNWTNLLMIGCAEFLETAFDKLIGVALENFETLKFPVNGLRHPIEYKQSTS
jgi:hypothetical protein